MCSLSVDFMLVVLYRQQLDLVTQLRNKDESPFVCNVYTHTHTHTHTHIIKDSDKHDMSCRPMHTYVSSLFESFNIYYSSIGTGA
jgi:hypothetical protein